MQKIKISTDSTADIPNNFCDELNISVLPLTILVGDKEYRDGIDITKEEFYNILDTAATLPVSSQVTSVLYAELFLETWKAGYTDLIHISINSKGSGTYQAAVMTRDMFYEEHPEAKESFTIHLVDSKTYSMAYGIPVVEAARMAKSGSSSDEILEHLRDWLEHARPLFVPLNLKCVKKSGRISPAAAFLGDAIGLKPLITFEDGEAKILSKARGDNKAIAALIETCLRERKQGTNYALVYGSNRAAFEQLRESCAKAFDIPPMTEYQVGCVIGINTGPNMIGILYRT